MPITIWKGKQLLGVYSMDTKPEVGMTLELPEVGLKFVVKTVVTQVGIDMVDVYV